MTAWFSNWWAQSSAFIFCRFFKIYVVLPFFNLKVLICVLVASTLNWIVLFFNPTLFNLNFPEKQNLSKNEFKIKKFWLCNSDDRIWFVVELSSKFMSVSSHLRTSTSLRYHMMHLDNSFISIIQYGNSLNIL